MNASDVLKILDNENIPPQTRRVAHALFIALLALERYGHTMSYAHDGGSLSEIDHDAGLIARSALEDIRMIERRVH